MNEKLHNPSASWDAGTYAWALGIPALDVVFQPEVIKSVHFDYETVMLGWAEIEASSIRSGWASAREVADCTTWIGNAS